LIGQNWPITGKRENMIQDKLRAFFPQNIFLGMATVQSKFWSAKGRLTPSKRKKTS
jgi:hypothetical protein